MPQTLAQLIREKWPGSYDQVDDRELEAAFRAKYPGSYDDVPSTPEPEQSAAVPSMGGRVVSGAMSALKGMASAAGELSGVMPALRGENPVIGQAKALKGMFYDPPAAMFEKAGQASGAQKALYAAAGLTPLVGPMVAHGAEEIAAGRTPELIGETIAGAMVPGGFKAAKGATKAIGSKMATRAAKAAERATLGAEADFALAMPPSKSAGWTAEDLRAAKPFLNEQHKTSPITNVIEFRDAAQSAISNIESKVSGYLEAFPTARIKVDVVPVVEKALKDHPRGKALDAAMRELEDLPLDRDLTLPELDRIRLQMNAENTAIMKRGNIDRATARKTDPGFAAREALAADIRDRLYGYLENRGVEGVRDLRRAEGSVIKLRNAAERQSMAGGRAVRSGAEAGLLRRVAAAGAEKVGTMLGAKAGAVGALGGQELGRLAGQAIRGTAPTRDALIQRAMGVADDRMPVYPEVPPPPRIAGELPPAPIAAGAPPDASYARGVPAQYAVPERAQLPPGRPPIETPPPADTSGILPIDESKLPENYVREMRERAALNEALPTGEALTPQSERAFLVRWMADDLREMSYEPGSRMGRAQRMAEYEQRGYGDKDVTYSGRVAGTPLQQMFHAAGIKGTRKEIAERLDRYMQTGKGSERIGALVDAMREAWDGQRFDFDLVSDETLARVGIRRRDLRSPITTPYPDDMPEVYDRFFQRGGDEDFQL